MKIPFRWPCRNPLKQGITGPPPRERLLCVPGHNAGAGGLPCSGHTLEVFHALSYLPVFTSENVHNPENIKGVLILWRKTSML